MKKLSFPAWSIPPALLLLCVISYGLVIPKLGYYWDDWPAIWFTNFYGSSSLVEVLGIDRPQLAWLYVLTTSLIGESRAGWQIFALLLRWLSCLALWWMLVQVWPQRRTEITWVSFLFAVYPGFRQQYIALIYSHDWIVIALFFLSIGLMVVAARRPKPAWLLMGISWLLAAYAMFADEYYFGLELLRPVFLWIVLRDQFPETRRRLRQVILLWLPYVIIMLAFLVWRLFIHVSPRGQVQLFDQMATNPLMGLLNLLKTVALDMLESGLVAWLVPFNLADIVQSNLTSIFLYFLLAAGVAFLSIVYLHRLRFSPNDPEKPDQAWARQAVFLGIFSLFIAGWPFWATAWQIGLVFPWDRFNLAMNFGACLLLTGSFILIFRKKLWTIIALGIILGMASANMFHLANIYRQDYELLKQFFWQLSWRAPAIEPDTLILTNRPPFTYSTDNSLTAPLNWIYAPDNRSLELPYLFWDVASHSPGGWSAIDRDKPFTLPYRITEFNGSFNQAISVFFKPPDCVKVLDPVIDADLPGKPLFITPGAAFSRPELILANSQKPANLPERIFGPEPERDWCYYFEKAELARQVGDWALVSELADQALVAEKIMTEANVLEWIPYIEGYARNQRFDEAETLTMRVYQTHSKMRRMLCALWERVETDHGADPKLGKVLERLNNNLACAMID